MISKTQIEQLVKNNDKDAIKTLIASHDIFYIGGKLLTVEEYSEYQKEIEAYEYYDMLQHTKKISLNSLYRSNAKRS
jgi:hypothetical protein